MNLLKITTAGSVDDGKSTLIGRLLFDTKSVPEDKKEAIYNTSIKRGGEEIDYALFTDGLTAERAQGITIDVAHIYFSTNKRKFIIADTPGHIEYTRNMMTGASNSEVAIILVDARNGVVEQTKRHLYILNLLQIKHIFVAINKMDLIAYDQEKFIEIRETFNYVAKEFGIAEKRISYYPIAAKYGENITTKSTVMPWYNGTTLLEALENFEDNKNTVAKSTIFNIQNTIRPKGQEWLDFRAYAGRLNDGQIAVGTALYTFPTKKRTHIKTIIYNKKSVEKSAKGQSICVQLENDLDLSRGEWLLEEKILKEEKNIFKATICWLNENIAAHSGSKFILQYGTARTNAKITAIESELKLDELKFVPSNGKITLNTIVVLEIKTAQATLLSNSIKSKVLNNFILIDEQTNHTVGVGIMNVNTCLS